MSLTFDAFLLRLNNVLAWFAIFMCTSTSNARLQTEWYSFLRPMNILNCYSKDFSLHQVFKWKCKQVRSPESAFIVLNEVILIKQMENIALWTALLQVEDSTIGMVVSDWWSIGKVSDFIWIWHDFYLKKYLTKFVFLCKVWQNTLNMYTISSIHKLCW